MATEPFHDDPGAQHAVTERSAVEARQGVISGRVLLVLLTSVTAAIIALVVGYFACTMSLPPCARAPMPTSVLIRTAQTAHVARGGVLSKPRVKVKDAN